VTAVVLGGRWPWPAEKKSQAVGCWSEAQCVTSLDVWVLPETGYTRRAGAVPIIHQVVGAPPLDVLLVDDGLSQVESTWEMPVRARFKTRLSSFSLPIRFGRGAPAAPAPSRFITGEFGPGAEPYPSDGCWAKPDPGTGADAIRHPYDHRDLVRELGRRGEPALPAYTTRPWRRPRSAKVPPRPVREPTDEP
jgi:hypothetical protein